MRLRTPERRHKGSYFFSCRKIFLEFLRDFRVYARLKIPSAGPCKSPLWVQSFREGILLLVGKLLLIN